MAAAGPTKITYYVNRADQCGWSVNFFTSTADLTTAENNSVLLRTRITALMAHDTNIVGIRYTDTNNPRVSLLRKFDLPNPAASDADTPDERTVCASFDAINALGQKESRSIRGLSDDNVVWDPLANKMVLTATGKDLMLALQQEMSDSIQQTYGWLPRLRKGVAGSATTAISSIAPAINGSAVLTVSSNVPLITTPPSPIIVGGFRGDARILNGTYLPSAFFFPSTTTIQLTKQLGAGIAFSYSGVGGTVRLATPTFSAYRKGQFFSLPNGVTVNTVRSRDTGRPFFLTHGRRGK